MAEIDTQCKYKRRWGALKQERSSWIPHYQEISDNLMPRAGRFFLSDRNDGNKRHNNIYDNTGPRALKILGAGMMSGSSSPARPWIRLTTADPDLAKQADVKIWLSDVTRMILRVFAKSNTYRSLHSMYEELGGFGTGATIVLPDYDNIIHHYTLTAGEYAIATDSKGRVNTIYREYEKTVANLVEEFGLKNCSTKVQDMYSRGDHDKWVGIIHCIEKRIDYDGSKKDGKNMPWASVSMESNAEKGKYLRESGFKTFPALVPRWALSGGDIYGNSPGMEALGDIKQLQHEQMRKGQTIDYKLRPPMVYPTALKGREVDGLPGGATFADTNATQKIETLFNVNLELQPLLEDIQDVRQRVRGSFYADLFMMLANQDTGRMTATEVAERHEEKLLVLGPVIERLHNELLQPLVEMTFARLLEAGVLPDVPESLREQDIQVEFVSILAQAQKAVATNSIDRYVNNLGAIAQFKPDILDKFDSDQWAEIYADSLGVDPALIVPGDKVALIRQARQEAQNAAAQQQANNMAADTAQKMATAAGGDLGSVMQGLQGYS